MRKFLALAVLLVFFFAYAQHEHDAQHRETMKKVLEKNPKMKEQMERMLR